MWLPLAVLITLGLPQASPVVCRQKPVCWIQGAGCSPIGTIAGTRFARPRWALADGDQ